MTGEYQDEDDYRDADQHQRNQVKYALIYGLDIWSSSWEATFRGDSHTGYHAIAIVAIYAADDEVPQGPMDLTVVTPEPGSLVLLGSGIFGLAGVLRRKIMP